MKKLFLIPVLLFFLAVGAWAETEAPKAAATADQAFVAGSITVKGEGAAPIDRALSAVQKRILALRAAKVVALREVAEIINGVAVSGDTTVENASVQSDTVRATVEGIVKGAQVVRESYDPMSEMAIVYVTVPMTGPDGIIARLLPQVVPLLPAEPFKPFQAPAEAVQARFDGLIIDARDEPFKPALLNRVVTRNGEVIYDPSKVAQNILVEHGAAEYTNDIGKAKALLGERGSTSPMVVKARGLSKSTDVQVDPETATAIFSSNQTANYLESAKVVFVLK